MTQTVQLLLIETKGNQPYVFATNRLRLAVGGSEHIYRVGLWAMEAAGLDPVEDGAERAAVLLAQTPIETEDSHGPEVIIATSGKALLLVRDEDTARSIVQNVTSRAFTDAPMLDVAGAFLTVDLGRDVLAERYDELVRLLARQRQELPSPKARSAQHPLVQRCAHSGLPATTLTRAGELGDSGTPISADVRARLDATRPGQRAGTAGSRLSRLASAAGGEVLSDLGKLEARLGDQSWMAVVHADGNGVGSVFVGLGTRFTKPEQNRAYVDFLREFSLGLEIITEDAFFDALAVLQSTSSKNAKKVENEEGRDHDTVQIPPLYAIPLLLGGDDATFVCSASRALELTTEFIERFTRYSLAPRDSRRLDTRNDSDTVVNNDIRTRLASAVNQGRMYSDAGDGFGMAAGVVATKVHFPFHTAYALAEELLNSAKSTKALGLATGSVDFHVLYDTTSVDLGDIRRRRAGHSDRVAQHTGPYVLGDDTDDFVSYNTIAALDDRLRGDHNDSRDLNALIHRLRSAALVSPERAREVLQAYRKAGSAFAEQTEPHAELIEPRPFGGNNGPTTEGLALLDVLDLAVLRVPTGRTNDHQANHIDGSSILEEVG